MFEKDDIVGQHIVGCCDLDYISMDLDKCQSTIGYVFALAYKRENIWSLLKL